MDTVISNTLKGIEEMLVAGKRTVKSIAGECRIMESQVTEDEHKAMFARLSDCSNRKQFAEVLATL